MDGASHPCSCHKDAAQPPIHEHRVAQGLAYGQVPVIGHQGVEEALGASQEMKEIELSHTAPKWHSLAGRSEIQNHPRNNDGGEPHVQEGQHAEQDVHGAGMELGVSPHSEQNEQVSQLSEDVDDEEDQEEEDFQFWWVSQAQENEFCYHVVQ